jgi:HEAT repeat protein
MPLIRTSDSRADAANPLVPQCMGVDESLTALTDAHADTRRRAATGLSQPGVGRGDERTSLMALGRQLAVERDAGVREAIFAAIGTIGGTDAAALLGPFLRIEDAGLRNGAVESLKRLGGDAVPVVDELLQDADADVRLLAVEVIGGWQPPLAAARLHRVLTVEANVNVVGAALDVAAIAGNASLLPALDVCRDRFADEAFIAFAIGMAQRSCASRPADAPPKRQSRARKPRRKGPVAS